MMTPDQRFAVIIVLLSGVLTLVGWYGQRLTKRSDDRWLSVDAKLEQLHEFASTRPLYIQRLERTEAGLAKLVETNAELGVQQLNLANEQTALSRNQNRLEDKVDRLLDAIRAQITGRDGPIT